MVILLQIVVVFLNLLLIPRTFRRIKNGLRIIHVVLLIFQVVYVFLILLEWAFGIQDYAYKSPGFHDALNDTATGVIYTIFVLFTSLALYFSGNKNGNNRIVALVEDIQKFALEDLENEYKDIFAKPVVITSGRLNKQKGHWHLIRSFFEVKQKIPDAKLVFLGEGELKNYLANLALELGIEKDVHFLGFQKNPFKFISRSKIFAMSSLYEGFPNALAEAMACGVPIVSSDCLSGPREILAPDEFEEETIDYGINKDRYGVLTPVCDGIRYDAEDAITNEEKVMAGHIIKLLEDKELAKYYGSQSLQRIEDFNIKEIIKQWEAII